MISNVCIITLIGIILILNGIILLSLNFAQPGSTSRPSEGKGSKDIENYIKEIHCRLQRWLVWCKTSGPWMLEVWLNSEARILWSATVLPRLWFSSCWDTNNGTDEVARLKTAAAGESCGQAELVGRSLDCGARSRGGVVLGALQDSGCWLHMDPGPDRDTHSSSLRLTSLSIMATINRLTIRIFLFVKTWNKILYLYLSYCT